MTAAATSQRAEVIVFHTGELDRVLQRIAAVRTCGNLSVVHNFPPPHLTFDGNVTPCPSFHSRKMQSCSVTTTRTILASRALMLRT